MDLPLNILEKLDIVNLIAMGSMLWFAYGRIEKKFEKIDQRFDKIDQRFDKMEEKMNDIDRRLCRLEGAFASKDCCMIKDDRKTKKVV